MYGANAAALNSQQWSAYLSFIDALCYKAAALASCVRKFWRTTYGVRINGRGCKSAPRYALGFRYFILCPIDILVPEQYTSVESIGMREIKNKSLVSNEIRRNNNMDFTFQGFLIEFFKTICRQSLEGLK